jgi:hypothetical protein
LRGGVNNDLRPQVGDEVYNTRIRYVRFDQPYIFAEVFPVAAGEVV